MPSPFQSFISGQKPALVLAENESYIAFLEEQPLSKGHAVVLPKREEDAFFDLSDTELSEIMVFAKRISQALKASVSCQKIGLSVLGLQARHAHIHLVPLNSPEDLNFTKSRVLADPNELSALAQKIKSHL